MCEPIALAVREGGGFGVKGGREGGREGVSG